MQGMQVYDASGVLLNNFTTRIFKVAVKVQLVGVNGSVTLPDLQGNEPFFYFNPAQFTPTDFTTGKSYPKFTIAGRVLYWEYQPPLAGGTPSSYLTGTLIAGTF